MVRCKVKVNDVDNWISTGSSTIKTSIFWFAYKTSDELLQNQLIHLKAGSNKRFEAREEHIIDTKEMRELFMIRDNVFQADVEPLH